MQMVTNFKYCYFTTEASQISKFKNVLLEIREYAVKYNSNLHSNLTEKNQLLPL